MASYMVSYDLHKKGEFDYTHLINAIKAYGTWCHLLESDWVIVSDADSIAIRDYLKPFIHRDDHLSIGKVTRDAAWYGLSTEISDWLKNNLSN